jgi:hypothetical protein
MPLYTCILLGVNQTDVRICICCLGSWSCVPACDLNLLSWAAMSTAWDYYSEHMFVACDVFVSYSGHMFVTFLSFIVCLPMMSITKLYYVMPVIKECDSELAYTRFLLTLLCGQLTTHSSMPCMSFITYSEVLFWPMMTKNVWDGYTVFLVSFITSEGTINFT